MPLLLSQVWECFRAFLWKQTTKLKQILKARGGHHRQDDVIAVKIRWILKSYNCLRLFLWCTDICLWKLSLVPNKCLGSQTPHVQVPTLAVHSHRKWKIGWRFFFALHVWSGTCSWLLARWSHWVSPQVVVRKARPCLLNWAGVYIHRKCVQVLVYIKKYVIDIMQNDLCRLLFQACWLWLAEEGKLKSAWL